MTHYPRYKDSGAGWLGEVPVHWNISPLKQVVRLRYGDALSADNRQEGKFLVYGSNGPVGTHSRANTGQPAIVVGRKGSHGKIVWAEDGGFVIDTAYAIDSDTTALNLKWVYYVLQPLGLNSLSQDTGVPGLTRERAYEVRIPVPPDGEQSAIAAFLDREIIRIDELVAEQQRLIDLLREKRQAVISQAVTKGLKYAGPMKDSGIEWLGEVAAHWRSGCLARIAERIVVGIAEAATHAYADDGIPILRSTNIRPGKITGEILKVTKDFAEQRGTKLIRSGDLITVRTGNAGISAVIPPELDGCQCFTMLITTLVSDASPEFYCYYINSYRAQQYFAVEGWGTAQINISVPILKALPIPIPPPAEQSAIVTYLNAETARFDTLIAEAQHAIALLYERRTALISAAVTGKIDVRRLMEKIAA